MTTIFTYTITYVTIHFSLCSLDIQSPDCSGQLDMMLCSMNQFDFFLNIEQISNSQHNIF